MRKFDTIDPRITRGTALQRRVARMGLRHGAPKLQPVEHSNQSETDKISPTPNNFSQQGPRLGRRLTMSTIAYLSMPARKAIFIIHLDIGQFVVL